MCWLRYGKKMPIVCTEAGADEWPADVLAMNKSTCIEVEVKISRSDIFNDFTKKEAKHYAYKNATDRASSTSWVPNFFYFLVPEELAKEAVEIISQKQPKAGIIAFSYDFGFRNGQRIRLVKPATELHNLKPSAKLRAKALLRMGSELCCNKLAFAKLGESEAVMKAQTVPVGILDVIDPQKELEVRASILAKALHGITWSNTTPGEKLQLISMVKALSEARFEEVIYERDG